MSSSLSAPPCLLGSSIDDGALELVAVLSDRGHTVVYRAVTTRPTTDQRKSYAVKCLLHPPSRYASQRKRLHMEEIALHKLASACRNVVTLHRVIEDEDHAFMVMDYCPDGDLFDQIVHRRYLGQDSLIKSIFLQLLDAETFCRSLGIYHRNLKPENVLCFDDGLRIKLTDFGLATTDPVSQEFRTGSGFHLSPECRGAESRPYSHACHDVWSLGIMLVNLITGRKPWDAAVASDPTFQAYLQDPENFLPNVLPISAEVNKILIAMLDVNWRSRIKLPTLRDAIKDVTSVYSDDVVFEGSMALCSRSDIESPTEEEPTVGHATIDNLSYAMQLPHESPEFRIGSRSGGLSYLRLGSIPPTLITRELSCQMSEDACIASRSQLGRRYVAPASPALGDESSSTTASGMTFKTTISVNSKKSKMNQRIVPPGTAFLR
ncbi:kinase-like protein [Auriscalpium vulgare]|uniref:Kinase-like protein n=1 Tax=Auriscalpium vulgare TaxID=40419 RepID=A0ACB8RAF7_9AGAM|nr:kinase-like protein [Auriscalpium vulgare]